MSLIKRIRRVCTKRNIPEDHIQWYIRNLNPLAAENEHLFTDEMINNSITSQELFWGLGDAINQYLQWESTQH